MSGMSGGLGRSTAGYTWIGWGGAERGGVGLREGGAENGGVKTLADTGYYR